MPAAAPMSWDSRVQSLELQVLEPLKALDEMRREAYLEERAVASAGARVAIGRMAGRAVTSNERLLRNGASRDLCGCEPKRNGLCEP